MELIQTRKCSIQTFAHVEILENCGGHAEIMRLYCAGKIILSIILETVAASYVVVSSSLPRPEARLALPSSD